MDSDDSVNIIETEVFVEQTKIFACGECPYQSLFQFALDAHWKTNHEQANEPFECSTNNLEQYKCKHCSYSTNFYTILWRHTKLTHHVKRTVREDMPKLLFLKDNTRSTRRISSKDVHSLEIFKTNQTYYLGDHNYFQDYQVQTSTTVPTNCSPYFANMFKKYMKYCVKVYKCHKCKYITNLIGSMESHIVSTHSFEDLVMWLNCDEYNENYTKYAKKLLFCKHCSYSTRRNRELKQHFLKTHDTVLSCNICYFHTSSHQELVNHHRFFCRRHSNEFYRCKTCLYRTTSKSLYEAHVAKFHIMEPPDIDLRRPKPKPKYECSYCNYHTMKLHALNTHIHHCHSFEIGPVNREDLQKHKELFPHLSYRTLLQMSVKETGTFGCTFANCDFKTDERKKLRQHRYNKHFRNPIPKEKLPRRFKVSGTYRCDYCAYRTKKVVLLRKHEAEKHFGLKLPATKTSKAKTKDTIKKFPCNKCRYSGVSKQCLRNHVYRKHTPENQITWFVCEICSYKSKERFKLTEHKRIRHDDGRVHSV